LDAAELDPLQFPRLNIDRCLDAGRSRRARFSSKRKG
jgi:hypothetical protein